MPLRRAYLDLFLISLIRHSRRKKTIAPLRGYLLHLVGMATR